MKLKSMLISAAGTIVPAFIFILLYPLLISSFGISRFGYISLALILLSISSLFDLGLSRGATYFIAKTRGEKGSSLSMVWGLFNISLIIGTIFSVITTCLLYIYFSSASHLVENNLNQELVGGIPYLALTIPLVVAHAVLKGILEGFEKFHIVTYAKIITALITASLLILISYSEYNNLTSIFLALFISRVLGLIVIITPILNLISYSKNLFIKESRSILVFSGWASVSNLSSTMLNYIDRFVAGYYLTSHTYGIYNAISDVIMRFLFVPGSICSVLYPHVAQSALDSLKKQILKCYFLILISIAPLIIITYIFGLLFFENWLKINLKETEFNLIIKFLLAGLFVTSLAQIPYAVLQGLGKSLITARLHLIEVTIFVPLIVFSGATYGLKGILIAWLLRIITDFILLFYLQSKLIKAEQNDRP